MMNYVFCPRCGASERVNTEVRSVTYDEAHGDLTVSFLTSVQVPHTCRTDGTPVTE